MESSEVVDRIYRVAAYSSVGAIFILKTIRNQRGDIIDFSILDVNPCAEVWLERTRDTLIGQKIHDAGPIVAQLLQFEYLNEVVFSGSAHVDEISLAKPFFAGKWLERQITPVEDAVFVAVFDISERKRTDAALHESEARYHALFNQSADGILIADIETMTFKYANQAICRMLGYTEGELRTMAVPDIHPKDAVQRVVAEFEAQARGDKTLAVDIPCIRKDGLVVHTDINTVKINIDGRPCNVGIFRDITNRKRAETQLAYHASLLKHVNDAVIASDESTVITSWNQAAEDIYGWKAEEIIGRRADEFLHTEYISDQPSEVYRRLTENGRYRGEWRQSCKNGRQIYVETTVIVLRDTEGRITGYVGVNRDITERKRAEATLCETQRQLTSIIANLPGVVYRCRNDSDWTIEFVSEGILHILGYPAADFMEHRRKLSQFIHPDDQGLVWEETQAALHERRRYGHTYRIITASGEEKWLWEQGGGVFDESGTLQALEGFAIDITERKRMEKAMQESEARLRLAVEYGGVGLWEWQVATEQLTWNDQFKTIFGLSPEISGLMLDKFLAVIHPEDRVETQRTLRWTLEHHAKFNHEYRIRWPDGTVRWVLSIARSDYDASGQPVKMNGVALDITDRKNAVEELRKNHDRLKKVLEVETVGVMFWDLTSGCLIDANNTFLNVMGYSRREVEARELTWQKLTPPEYMEMSLTEIREFQVSGRVGPYEKEYFRKDGTRQWFVFAGSSLGDNNCVEFCVDISARKRAEEMAHRQAALLNQTYDAIFAWQVEGRIVFWNRGAEVLYGYPGTEAIARFSHDLLHTVFPESLPHVLAELQRTGRWEGELRHQTRDGRWVTVDSRMSLVHTAGELLVVEANRDITYRKCAEAALRESEERLRLAHKATNDVVWDWDVIHDAQQWNEAGRAVFGWKEIVEHPVSAHWWIVRVHPEDRQRVEASFFKAVNDPAVDYWRDEYRFQKADGNYAAVMDRGYVLRDASGKAVRMIGAMLDITERKRADEIIINLNIKLEQRVRELATLNKLGNKINSNLSLAQTITDALAEIIAAVTPDMALIYLQQNNKGSSCSRVGHFISP